MLTLLLIIVFVVLLFLMFKPTREHFRDPIYMDKDKLMLDYYPQTNGTIYGNCSDIFSGYSYYDKAY